MPTTSGSKSATTTAANTEVFVPDDMGYDLTDDTQKAAAIARQLEVLGLTGATVSGEEPHPDGGLKLTIAAPAG